VFSPLIPDLTLTLSDLYPPWGLSPKEKEKGKEILRGNKRGTYGSIS